MGARATYDTRATDEREHVDQQPSNQVLVHRLNRSQPQNHSRQGACSLLRISSRVHHDAFPKSSGFEFWPPPALNIFHEPGNPRRARATFLPRPFRRGEGRAEGSVLSPRFMVPMHAQKRKRASLERQPAGPAIAPAHRRKSCFGCQQSRAFCFF